MNKKLIIGISAGVALLLAVIIAIVAITGNLNFNKPGGKDGSSSNPAASSAIAPSKEDDDGNKEFTVEPEKVEKESVISVPIIIKNNPGFYAGEFAITFNSNELSYVDYSEGKILDQYDVHAVDGAIKIIANNSAFEDVKKDGTLMLLNFKVLKKSSDGKYTITLQKKGTMLGNISLEEVKADILLGQPIVK